MGDAARLLESLHPMREPPPPASLLPILVMLALGCIGALVALVVLWRIRRRHGALRAAASAALAATRGLAPAERLAAQARVLRRLVRSAAGEDAARAQGGAWLARLDGLFATHFFTKGQGTVFGETLYRRPADVDVDALDRSLSDLFARMRLGGAPVP